MAASPQQAPFDIRSLSACLIRLGRSAQQASAPSRYTGIQYNHKPTTSNPKQTSTSITPPDSGSKQFSLRLKDGQDEYLYKGSQGTTTTEHTYVLVPDQEGDGYILERLDSSYKFNLSKAPGESNAQALGQRYPQLEIAHDDDDDDDEEEGELFGDDATAADVDGEADDDNPFDFRHYMHAVESPSPPSQPTKSSAAGTPSSSIISQTSTRTNTPMAKSTAKKAPSAFALQERRMAATKKKTKAKTEERQQAQTTKRAKLSPEAEHRREDIPTVRLDRRASTRVAAPAKKAESRPQQQQQQQQRHLRNKTDELSLDFEDHGNHDDDDDEGDLILEGDAPQASSSYRNQRSLGAALPGTLGVGNGPRSLQSAASSPASITNSPHSLQHQHQHQQHGNHHRGTSPYDRHVDTDGEEISIDMGAGSPDELELDDGGYVDEDADAEGDDDNDDNDGGELIVDDDDDPEEDEDVDEMHLPSPAQVHRPSVSNTVVTADEYDDLENQMLLALEGGGGDEDDMSGGLQESEEESEEE